MACDLTHVILLEGDRLYEAYINTPTTKRTGRTYTSLVRGDRSLFDLDYRDLTKTDPKLRDHFGDNGKNTCYGVTVANEHEIEAVQSALTCSQLWTEIQDL